MFFTLVLLNPYRYGFNPYSAGIDFSQLKTKIFLMVVDPKHRYSNESERANLDIYDDLKLKKTLWSPWFMKNCQRFKG